MRHDPLAGIIVIEPVVCCLRQYNVVPSSWLLVGLVHLHETGVWQSNGVNKLTS